MNEEGAFVGFCFAVVFVIIAFVAGNAYVTHERTNTYQRCLATHIAIDDCKSLKP